MVWNFTNSSSAWTGSLNTVKSRRPPRPAVLGACSILLWINRSCTEFLLVIKRETLGQQMVPFLPALKYNLPSLLVSVPAAHSWLYIRTEGQEPLKTHRSLPTALSHQLTARREDMLLQQSQQRPRLLFDELYWYKHYTSNLLLRACFHFSSVWILSLWFFKPGTSRYCPVVEMSEKPADREVTEHQCHEEKKKKREVSISAWMQGMVKSPQAGGHSNKRKCHVKEILHHFYKLGQRPHGGDVQRKTRPISCRKLRNDSHLIKYWFWSNVWHPWEKQHVWFSAGRKWETMGINGVNNISTSLKKKRYFKKLILN